MADVVNQNLLDEPLMASAEAEPEERARCTAIVLVGVLTLSLTAIAWVLIEYVHSPESSRFFVAALVVGLLFAVAAFFAWHVFLFIIGEWQSGNPKGSRFVDTLLSI